MGEGKMWGTVISKIGIPKNLLWGYLGIIFFMIGDGLEQGWLSPYVIEKGLSMQQSTFMFSVYGITVTIAAWLSGFFVQMWGARKAMLIGLVLFAVGTITFISIGIIPLNYPAMLISYGIRGFGYPLFAYSFIVWLSYRVPQQRMAFAMGGFWFVFSLGMSVIGPYYSGFMIPRIGHVNTLWSALFFVALGGLLALVVNKDKSDAKQVNANNFVDLLREVSIVYTNPKMGLAAIVKIINELGQYGFVVFLPVYVASYGFSTGEWLQIYGALFTSAIIFNLIFGIIGDKIGWIKTITWFGAVGCAVTTLAIYYTPQIFGHNYWMLLLAVAAFGATLAGYIPLSALMPSLAPDNKGAAVSVMNLSNGLGAFVAPALVGIFIGSIGTGGVMWLFAILYLVSAFLTRFLTLPKTSQSINTNVESVRYQIDK